MANTKLCVALTGASGFVGRHVLPQLLVAGHRVRVLLRDESRLGTRDSKLHVVKGTVFDDGALAQLVDGADAVVHLVGIIMEVARRGQTFERVHVDGTQRLLVASQSAGVKRWVQMSALGTRPNAISRYHRTKWTAEQVLHRSGLGLTVFRPSLIHGFDGEFIQMVKGFWCGLAPPFVPYFGKEQTAGRLQPVWVEDVVRCMVESLMNDKTIGETYPMGGPKVYTWPDLYRVCQKHLPRARNKPVVGLPVWVAKAMASLPGAPFNQDQVIMSQEDSTCQIGKVQQAFGIELAGFESTFAEYAAQIP